MHGEPVRYVDAGEIQVGQEIVLVGADTGVVTEIIATGDGRSTWRVVREEFIRTDHDRRQMIVDRPPRQVLTAPLVATVPAGRYEPTAGHPNARGDL